MHPLHFEGYGVPAFVAVQPHVEAVQFVGTVVFMDLEAPLASAKGIPILLICHASIGSILNIVQNTHASPHAIDS